MDPFEEDLEDYSWFHFAQSVKTLDNISIAEFPNAKQVSPNPTSSPDGNYIANYQGVFNKENELLIALSSFFIDNSGVAICFSTDSRFVKLSYIDGPERIFALDPTLFPDGTQTIPTIEPTPLPTSLTPTDQSAGFGLGLTPQLGELGLASITATGNPTTQPQTLTTPTGEIIDQPIGATLPEAGVNNWWSWNLAILILFLGGIICGTWCVIR